MPFNKQKSILKVEQFDDDLASVSSSEDGDSSTPFSVSMGVSQSSSSPTTTDSEAVKIALSEERLVSRARLSVLFVFLLCAAALSGVMYYIVSQSEKNHYEIEYEGFVHDITVLTQWEMQNNMALMQALAASVTTSAYLSNSTFPYLTNNEFEVSGGYVDGLTGIISIGFAPHVTAEQQDQWEKYTVAKQGWLEVGSRLRKIHPQHKDPLDGSFQDHEERRQLDEEKEEMPKIHPHIFKLDDSGNMVDIKAEPGTVMAPVWQLAPTPGHDPSMVNFDLLSDPFVYRLYEAVLQTRDSVVSPAVQVDFLFKYNFDVGEEHFMLDPHSYFMEPVFESFEPDAEIIGVLIGLTAWENYFNNILPEGDKGIICVVKDSCGTHITYELDGPKPVFLGYDDIHDTSYDDYERNVQIAGHALKSKEGCSVDISIYPSKDFVDTYTTSDPIIYTVVVALAFLLTGLGFFIYDIAVNRRQAKTMAAALKTRAIVDSMFPKNVRDRILANAQDAVEKQTKGTKGGDTFFDDVSEQYANEDLDGPFSTKPIADFFPSASIMFCDVAGFTAWSSTREPSQVFTLLETLYTAFDRIAKKRRVFKVETVGDCYVAACGVPETRKNHAVIMCRFALDCLRKSNEITRMLETRLGPDTGDLSVRIGLHLGSVTAGVLRGDNARFQLFGDTMNTCARIESASQPNRILISKEMAEALDAAGKNGWYRARDETVYAKGKGEMTTFWLSGGKNDSYYASSSGSTATPEETPDASEMLLNVEKPAKEHIAAQSSVQNVTSHISQKEKRLVDWNVDVLKNILKAMIARRNGASKLPFLRDTQKIRGLEQKSAESNNLVVDEIKEIVQLPKFDPDAAVRQKASRSVEIDEKVLSQLKDYITNIACMYHDNPFHSFEHASHVAMSTTKLLARIVSPAQVSVNGVSEKEQDLQNLHDHTYGITSDPMTQFACVISALIHDVDHQGVPNATLIAEETPTAIAYNNKSVAEQNSVDLAWKLLMKPEYEDLRNCIYVNESEYHRFRALVVNSVMATDIMDKDLKNLRNARWQKAFDDSGKERPLDEEERDSVNRKATIVIEHIIQASDVAHTMQHWHIYRKWNERLFFEMHRAFKDGRIAKDPTQFWYQGEMGFFDFYIIPLAKKLKDCGVFGVSSDEYLNYAQKNRAEWEARGQEMVAQMIEKMEQEELEAALAPAKAPTKTVATTAAVEAPAAAAVKQTSTAATPTPVAPTPAPVPMKFHVRAPVEPEEEEYEEIIFV